MLSMAESSDSDIEPLFLDASEETRNGLASEETRNGLGSTWTRPAEDQRKQRRGIPIPRHGHGHGMSNRGPSTWDSEMLMDDESVLEQLAASEGGFSPSWQDSQQGR